MNGKRTLAVALCMVMALWLIPSEQLIPAAKAFDLPQAGLNYDQYPALREVYKDYFLVGTIDRFDNPIRTEFMSYTYNAVTNENNMKPSGTQNTKGKFTLDAARKSFDNAEAGIKDVKLIGHTLTWHSQSPNWLWDAPNFDRQTALDNLNAHIDGVLGELGARLYSIDVVNEAIGSVNSKSPEDWKAALDKGEGWSLALGWEWVELAFVRAAKVVDENGWDCKLYYNDFSLDSPDKAQAVYEMVKDINERYAGQRPNGKPLIEGIGMQGHYNMSTKTKNVEATVALFATLPGVKVSFTEMDIEYLNEGTLNEEQAVSQAQKYALLFEIFKKYAAGPGNTTDNPKVIERVTLWGADDGSSWKGSGLPMLFNAPVDGKITAKEALLGALWPEEYLAKYPAPEETDDTEVYSVPGVYVFSLSRGNTWSGANIILGSDASQWPWSTTGNVEEGEVDVAFTPEKDAVYRLSVNYTALGTAGLRVRWIKDNTNGSYTAKDGQVVNTPPYNVSCNPDQVATLVPAHFNSGMVNAGTYTLVTEVTMDSSLPADDLIGNLAIRGTSGGNAYEINWIKMETLDGEQMFLWDPNAVPEPTPEPTLEPTPEVTATEAPSPSAAVSPSPQASTEPDEKDGNNNTIIIVVIVILAVILIAVALVLILKKKGGKK